MNLQDIKDMKPGRELDALVATKIMNLCVLDCIGGYGDGCVVSDEGWQEWMKHPMCGTTDDPDFLPPYTTDISASWEVAEKMSAPFHIQKSYQERYRDGPLGWMVTWCDNEGDCGCWQGDNCINDKQWWAPTTAEAICKAALIAKYMETPRRCKFCPDDESTCYCYDDKPIADE